MSFFAPADVKGRGIISFTWQATALFSVTAIITAISPSLFFRVVAVTVALVLFGLGMIVFLVAYLRAIGRSRYEVISVAGVYLMTGGVAPAAVRRSMYAALAVQIIVALVTASVMPYSSLAFGVLVPLFGLAMCGLWSSVCGTFAARADADAVELEEEEPG
jgi:hypothetical protein